MESKTEARATLDRYLHEVDEHQEDLIQVKPTDSKLRVLLKPAIPVSLRGRARMLVTTYRRASRAASRGRTRDESPLLLHLGSGPEHKDGWINIDLLGDPVEIAWNLARPIPFDSDSADGIFHEHLLEHLSLSDGLGFLTECHRVLRPGGLLRIGVPDAGRLVQSYAHGGEGMIDETRPGRPTPLLAMQEMFYWHRHETMYDFDTLALVCKAAGFDDVKQKEFGDTDLPRCPDTERRRTESLYVEARQVGAFRFFARRVDPSRIPMWFGRRLDDDGRTRTAAPDLDACDDAAARADALVAAVCAGTLDITSNGDVTAPA